MMNSEIYQTSLFPDFVFTSLKPDVPARSLRTRKGMIMNMDLHRPTKCEGEEQLPKVKPYVGEIPDVFVTYDERRSCSSLCGVCFYTDDYRIERVFSRPIETMSQLKQRHSAVIAPDFSVFVDLPKSVNVCQLFKNRWTTSYWQSEEILVIPSASWGAVDSFSYCFDGLPENSVLSIGHVAVGRSKAEKELYRSGVYELVRRKKPLKLLVYGEPLGFPVDVEVKYVRSFIQRKFR